MTTWSARQQRQQGVPGNRDNKECQATETTRSARQQKQQGVTCDRVNEKCQTAESIRSAILQSQLEVPTHDVQIRKSRGGNEAIDKREENNIKS